MNRFLKIVSLGMALFIGATLLVGCRDEKDITQKIELVFEASDKAISDENGEILIYKTVKLDKDIEGVLVNTSEDTFVQFRNNIDEPDFELTRDYSESGAEKSTQYQFVKEGDVMIELFDGRGDYAEVAPDIFEEFKLTFTAADVDYIEVTAKEKGFKEYKFYMTEAYINTFDSEADGLTKDCTDIAYGYYVNNYKNLSNVLREYVYTVTYNGEAQQLIEFVDAKID